MQATIADVQDRLGSVAEELGEEIRRSLDYYMSQDHDARVDLIILTGRAPCSGTSTRTSPTSST